jgi:septation ring formation regulator EzrA
MNSPQGAFKMTAAFFDTLQFVHNLSAAGMPTPQAEALAKECSQLLRYQLEQMATKADLKNLEDRMDAKFQNLKGDLKNLEDRMDAKFQNLEDRMDAKFQNFEGRVEAKLAQLQLRIAMIIGGSITTATGILLAGLKLFIH